MDCTLCLPSIVEHLFEGSHIRSAYNNETGDVFFCLKDILEAQGSSTKPAHVLPNLDDIFGDGVKIVIPIPDSMGRMQDTIFVSEHAATYIVSKGKTEKGKRLNRWLFTEVLPTIRKTGRYDVRTSELFAFSSMASMVRHLRDRGINVSETKARRDKSNGRLTVQADGTVLISEADRYAHLLLRKQVDDESRQIEQDEMAEERAAYKIRIEDRRNLLEYYSVTLKLFRGLGLKGNRAIIAACRQVHEETGTDCLELVGASHLFDLSGEPASEDFTYNDFKDFIEDECLIDSKTRVGATVLYERFREWCGRRYNNPDDIPSQKKFGAFVRQMFKRYRSQGYCVY